jgi:integrase
MRTTLHEFLESYYVPLKLRGRSPNTIRLYKCTISSFKKFLRREPLLEDVFDEMTISRFLSFRASERSPFTAEKERTQIMAMARFCHERRMAGDKPLPCVPPTPLPVRIPEAWAIDDIKKIMKACEKSDHTDYFKALITVLWETAERIGAITSVLPSDYANGKLLVRAEYRKGGKRDKIYSLSEKCQDALHNLLRSKRPAEAIFSWHKKKTNLWYAFGKIVEAAGLPGGRRCKFHMLRRSAATHFAALGGNPTDLLDHSSPRVTKAYLDPRFLNSGPQPCDVLPDVS